MFTMHSFKIVVMQAVKGQIENNKHWISAFHQALFLADKDGNLTALRMLCETVHTCPGMRVMPLVEAIRKAGGTNKNFEGMILVSIEKTEDKQTVFRISKNKEGGDRPLVDKDILTKSRFTGWWDFAKPEKLTPPAQFKSVIDALKKMQGKNTLLTAKEKEMVNKMTAMIVHEFGGEVFEDKKAKK